MAYFVYVLKSEKDHRRYIGLTNNLIKRISQHNLGYVKSTRSRIPFKLQYVEEFAERLAARNREVYFKTAAGRRFLDNLD